jgi:TM2 domain-containing membrane protein YozV
VRSLAAKSATPQMQQPVHAQQNVATVMVVANQTHGVPALLSFFISGLGQLIKGHIAKAFGIWIAMFLCVVMGFAMVVPFFAIPIIWVWAIYDAYKSNSSAL